MDAHPSPRILRSHEEVIRTLGGVSRVALLVNRSKASVSNWRRVRTTPRNGRFPAELYFVMLRALTKIDCTAPRGLWAFEGEAVPTELPEYIHDAA